MEKVREVRKDFKIVPTDADIENELRPTLTVKWDGADRKVVAIGINPSIATTGKSDVTVTKLCRIVDMYGFNHLTMLDIYEDVATKQTDLKRRSVTDFKKHMEVFNAADIVLVIWGRTKVYSEQIKKI